MAKCFYTANENGVEIQKVAGDEFVAGNVETAVVASDIEVTTIDENSLVEIANDNSQGDQNPPPSSNTLVSVANDNESTNEDEKTSFVEIDVDEVSKRTHISKNELIAICSNTTTAVAIPSDLTQLCAFITINEGYTKVAKKLSKKKKLPSEARSYLLKRAQEFGYLWLKSEVQLGAEIRQIKRRMGNRSDLQAANDNNPKRNKADMDKVIEELRTKGQILKDDYDLSYNQARDISRLTDELVEKELKYCQKFNEVPSRQHALSFLSRPPEQTEEELEDADAVKAQKKTKAKFTFVTTFSDVPFEQRKRRKLKHILKYGNLFSCIGSDEYLLKELGFECIVANELDPERAEYWQLLYPHSANAMVQGDFREKFDELATRFTENNGELLICTNPCQCFCAQRSADWRDQEILTLVIDIIRFIKKTKPKYLVWENAKEFFGFSLPLCEDLSKHPIAQELQTVLNGRTIGQYIREELELEGYTLNFSIENACYYGTAQNRVRSILLASQTSIWKFPKAEKFAKALFEVIGHLPSLEAGESSDIPYHYSSDLSQDTTKAEQFKEILAHTPTGCLPKDNAPQYQLPGWAFFEANGGRKFWHLPSNTIDGGNGNPKDKRAIHPGRLKQDGTYSDCRPLTLLEIFLVNGLPQSYEVPEKFRTRETFIRRVMGEILLPQLLQRICLELPLPDEDWVDADEQD